MSSTFQVDLSDFTELEERLAEYQGNSEKVINNVLLGQGAEEIMKSINVLIPAVQGICTFLTMVLIQKNTQDSSISCSEVLKMPEKK